MEASGPSKRLAVSGVRSAWHDPREPDAAIGSCRRATTTGEGHSAAAAVHERHDPSRCLTRAGPGQATVLSGGGCPQQPPRQPRERPPLLVAPSATTPDAGCAWLELAMVSRHSVTILVLTSLAAPALAQTARPRARDLGIVVGVLPPGPLNAITDVAGVRVGHTTLVRGDSVRTGVTAILPHDGQPVPGESARRRLRRQRLRQADGLDPGRRARRDRDADPADQHAQRAARRRRAARLDARAARATSAVRSINPIVAETNDGLLNDIRGRHVGRDEVFAALDAGDGRAGRGRRRRRRHRHGRVRLQGRHRHRLARRARRARRLHRRRAGAVELRRRAHDRRRAGGRGAGPATT